MHFALGHRGHWGSLGVTWGSLGVTWGSLGRESQVALGKAFVAAVKRGVAWSAVL
jgi:hypothetical protein